MILFYPRFYCIYVFLFLQPVDDLWKNFVAHNNKTHNLTKNINGIIKFFVGRHLKQ